MVVLMAVKCKHYYENALMLIIAIMLKYFNMNKYVLNLIIFYLFIYYLISVLFYLYLF